ncbi:MAG TPA: hypothetical protein VEB21_04145 [Terriglobales bacterium]|nr:hypothetical protein [Terriglobales bacterium]
MKLSIAAALFALVMGAAAADPVHAERGGLSGGRRHGPPAFLAQVFSPKLVMQHQQEIGLRSEQTEAIKKAMNDTQAQLNDLQWKLDAESESLSQLLKPERVDEHAVLAKLEQVLAIEQQVKRTNFALLVQIKNQLDADQQAKLRALQETSGDRRRKGGD